MPYTTVVPSQTITAAWGNQNVRDQVITPFATAAARTSAITAPVAGMLSSLTDVNGLDFYDGTIWRPPNVLYARRTADATGITSNTALADDGVLQVNVAANAVYEVRSHIIYLSGTNGDFKVGWSAPAGATFDWNIAGPGSTSTDPNTAGIYPNANIISGSDIVAGYGSTAVCRPSGILITAGTSGLFKLRWAQGTSDNITGTNTRTGSTLLLTRIG